jgi:hypothetical protein
MTTVLIAVGVAVALVVLAVLAAVSRIKVAGPTRPSSSPVARAGRSPTRRRGSCRPT